MSTLCCAFWYIIITVERISNSLSQPNALDIDFFIFYNKPTILSRSHRSKNLPPSDSVIISIHVESCCWLSPDALYNSPLRSSIRFPIVFVGEPPLLFKNSIPRLNGWFATTTVCPDQASYTPSPPRGKEGIPACPPERWSRCSSAQE